MSSIRCLNPRPDRVFFVLLPLSCQFISPVLGPAARKRRASHGLISFTPTTNPTCKLFFHARARACTCTTPRICAPHVSRRPARRKLSHFATPQFTPVDYAVRPQVKHVSAIISHKVASSATRGASENSPRPPVLLLQYDCSFFPGVSVHISSPSFA